MKTASVVAKNKAPCLNFHGMSITVENITPDVAEQWLHCNEDNRPLRQQHGHELAEEMRLNKWQPNPTAMVCFGENGNITNGQHTLYAIFESGKAQDLVVVRNMPKKVIPTIDVGFNRTPADNAHYLGIKLTATDAATLNAMWSSVGTRKSKLSHVKIFALFQKHAKALRWVNTEMMRNSTSKLPGKVRGVLARAWYTVPKDRLAQFIQILQTGESSGGKADSAAIRLRDFLRTPIASRSHESRLTNVYKTTEFALFHFANSMPMKQGQPIVVNEELFRTPRDVEAAND